MNLQQLRYVAATVDHDTMTAAAAALHVSQPALTRAIRALERELGVPLFVRSGRRVVPTPAGLAVAERARQLLRDVDQLRTGAATLPVTVATTPTLGCDVLPALLGAWFRRHPELTVVLRHLPSPVRVAAAVDSGQAAIGLADLPVPRHLATVPVGEREAVLLCPRASRVVSPVAPSDWYGLRLIAPDPGSYRRTQIDALFDRIGAAPRIVCETDERAAWPALAAAGVGHVIVSRSQAERADPGRTRIAAFDPPLRQTIALLHRPGRLPRTVADMIAFAVSEQQRETTGWAP